jgi:hypothetical protein
VEWGGANGDGEWSGEERMETESGEGRSGWRRRVEWGEVDGEGECEVGRSQRKEAESGVGRSRLRGEESGVERS